MVEENFQTMFVDFHVWLYQLSLKSQICAFSDAVILVQPLYRIHKETPPDNVGWVCSLQRSTVNVGILCPHKTTLVVDGETNFGVFGLVSLDSFWRMELWENFSHLNNEKIVQCGGHRKGKASTVLFVQHCWSYICRWPVHCGVSLLKCIFLWLLSHI